MSVHFEILDLQANNQYCKEAARLLLTEVGRAGSSTVGPTEDEVALYIQDLPERHVHYICLDDETADLVGAACVEHVQMPGMTSIHALAIHPKKRLRNYGRMFLHFIAMESLRHGDEQIGLGAYAPEFFERLGFRRPYAPSQYMQASVKDILEH